jgi:hypothetical protein
VVIPVPEIDESLPPILFAPVKPDPPAPTTIVYAAPDVRVNDGVLNPPAPPPPLPTFPAPSEAPAPPPAIIKVSIDNAWFGVNVPEPVNVCIK